MYPLLLSLAVLAAASEKLEGLALHLEVTPTEARLGDVLFLRVSVENQTDEPIVVPPSCLLETGTLRLRLDDDEESTSYSFEPDGSPGGWGGSEVLLAPDETLVVNRSIIRLPRLDRLNHHFWNPRLWRRGQYWLYATCHGLAGPGTKIVIDNRPENEMQALLECYDGGESRQSVIPPDFDSKRPCVGLFGLLTFPPEASSPDMLAALEKELSPGSLRRVVHITRLAQDLYDAKDDEQQRQAIVALEEWLDGLAAIEREWMSMRLVSFCIHRRWLRFLDLAERLVPRMPDSSRGLGKGGREEAFKEIQGCRKYLEQGALIRHGRGEPLPPPVWRASHLAASRAPRLSSLLVALDVDSHKILVGDPVYVRVLIRNTGEQPVLIPNGFKRSWGNIRFELSEYLGYMYWVRPHGGIWGKTRDEPLGPGGVRVIIDQLRMPPMDRVDEPFWNPDKTSLYAGAYNLIAWLRLGGDIYIRGGTANLKIHQRDNEERTAIKQFYDGGIAKHRLVPPGWDRHRPTMQTFSLHRFPLEHNTREKLAHFEEALSPGGLRRVVHITRLAQDLYDAKDHEQQRQAITALEKWLDGLASIEREWMSMALFKYCILAPKPCMLDLAERIVPRMPDTSRGVNKGGREKALKEIQDRR